jgi:hypothetical protein
MMRPKMTSANILSRVKTTTSLKRKTNPAVIYHGVGSTRGARRVGAAGRLAGVAKTSGSRPT